MPAFASLSLLDGASTPVSHTFSPVKIDAAGVAHFAERTGGIGVGFATATLSVRAPSKTSRNYKVVAKMVVPTLETITGPTVNGITPPPTKAYDCMATIEFVLPDRSTAQERKNLRAMFKNMIGQSPMIDAIESLENIY